PQRPVKWNSAKLAWGARVWLVGEPPAAHPRLLALPRPRPVPSDVRRGARRVTGRMLRLLSPRVIRAGSATSAGLTRVPAGLLTPHCTVPYGGDMSTDRSPVPDYPALLRLDGRRFVVVGAGQGIGRQTAHALATAGARGVCADVDRDRAEAVAAEGGGVAWGGDMRDRAGVGGLGAGPQRAVGCLEGLGDTRRAAPFGPFLDCSDEDWDWSFGMVLRHAYLTAQVAGRAMAGRGGVMVFVASVSGLTGAPRHAAYGAAKAGLMALVRTIAVELGPLGVRANAVAPGAVW